MAREVISTKLYHENALMGEVFIYPQNDFFELHLSSTIRKGIHIKNISLRSQRYLPLVILHSISSNGVCFKIEAKEQDPHACEPNFIALYKTCLEEAKTAVIEIGANELHLVALPTLDRKNQIPCFWCYDVVPGLYSSCIEMLTLKCLSLVFDLDETLISATTLRGYEDRIEALKHRIATEVDQDRVSAFEEEIIRNQSDKKLLQKYIETDAVVDAEGNVYRAQHEVVPSLSDSSPSFTRPVVRWEEKNIILTRINPKVRDTSVLVKLRPAWEDLKGYMTDNGRKRFEVYVCTMAERDYALEMWRLLDIEEKLISRKDIASRIVCVRSVSKKSLRNVFKGGSCDPKMAMIIDDRLNVWEDSDQPRVHVVPPYLPYSYSEISSQLPVLSYARNIVSQARVDYFKDFDDDFSKSMSQAAYEIKFSDLPSALDTSNYKKSEDNVAAPKPLLDRNALEKEEKRTSVSNKQVPLPADSLNNESKYPNKRQTVHSSQDINVMEQYVESSSGREVHEYQAPKSSMIDSERRNIIECNIEDASQNAIGEIPGSELDINMKRRLLILKHGKVDKGHTSANQTSSFVSSEQSYIKSNCLSFRIREDRSQYPRMTPLQEMQCDSEYMGREKVDNRPPPSMDLSNSQFGRGPPQEVLCMNGNQRMNQKSNKFTCPSDNYPRPLTWSVPNGITHVDWRDHPRDLQIKREFASPTRESNYPHLCSQNFSNTVLSRDNTSAYFYCENKEWPSRETEFSTCFSGQSKEHLKNVQMSISPGQDCYRHKHEMSNYGFQRQNISTVFQDCPNKRYKPSSLLQSSM